VVATARGAGAGHEVGEWVCEAVVAPSRPLKLTCRVQRWVSVSTMSVAVPVPGEAFAGDSFGPLSVVA
jgi:hypothetical protein